MFLLTRKGVCGNSYSQKSIPKSSYLLLSDPLLSNKNDLIYFLQQLGKVKKNEILLLVRPPFCVSYCLHITLHVLTVLSVQSIH